MNDRSRLFTRDDLRNRLAEYGYPITKSYFDKICLPSRNAGPPVAKMWGKRPLYELEPALAWAESNCTKPVARAA